jgi:tetratricopeptide (TPR) repeat protein
MVTKPIRTSLSMLMVAFLFAGCVRLALQFSPSLIPHMTETLFEECDPELARQSLPADLKLMEGLLKNDPNNRRLLTALCIGFTGYSLLFVEEENQERASKLYLRAMEYGARVLDHEMGSLEEFTADSKTLQHTLMSLGEAEHVALFWFAMSWNAWINLNRDQPAALAQLGSAQSCVERVLEIKPDYLYGAPYILMGSILAERPRMLGGDEARARECFERALALSNGTFLLVHYYFARYYAVRVQNKGLFLRLLEEIESNPADGLKEVCLINSVIKRRVQGMRNLSGELFL